MKLRLSLNLVSLGWMVGPITAAATKSPGAQNAAPRGTAEMLATAGRFGDPGSASDVASERGRTRTAPSFWNTAAEIKTNTDGALLSAATAVSWSDRQAGLVEAGPAAARDMARSVGWDAVLFVV
jgi:hypothetical protein